jgi:hypothetical protein
LPAHPFGIDPYEIVELEFLLLSHAYRIHESAQARKLDTLAGLAPCGRPSDAREEWSCHKGERTATGFALKSFLRVPCVLCGEFFTGIGAKWIRLPPRT